MSADASLTLMAALQQAQQERGALLEDTLASTAKAQGLPLSKVKAYATFFTYFKTEEAPYRDPTPLESMAVQAPALFSVSEADCKNALLWGAKEPEKVLALVKEANLLGRGGALYPTGKKWAQVAELDGPRVLVCNADEGEIGVSSNRAILEERPELTLTGMALCCYAIGAEEGFLYLRKEYEALLPGIERALAKMEAEEFIGKAPAKTQRPLLLRVFLGMGAYICGEETALLESMEGKRGEPRLKPPFPTERGLTGRPTVINNAETLSYVPYILSRGAAAFSRTGDPQCPGCKLITVTGAVKNPGVYEEPTGKTVGEILRDCGGLQEGKTLLGFQSGGASGALGTAEQLQVPFSPEGCKKAGLTFGAGGLCFFGADTDIKAFLLQRLSFFAFESCGLCTPCRLGLPRLITLLQGDAGISALKSESLYIQQNARCPLGAAAVTALLSALERFPAAFEKEAEK